jgi:aspartyl-tRNA(Asn)/glutamyl-tRNA(Gln) amidotransferase subunit B
MGNRDRAGDPHPARDPIQDLLRRADAFGAEPNTQACAMDLGLPGVLPVLNRQAVVLAVRFGRRSTPRSRSARSSPARTTSTRTSPRATRSASTSCPSSVRGQVRSSSTTARREDHRRHPRPPGGGRGKSLHEDFHGFTGIDLNRAGTPLLEIVSEPDMRSPPGGGRLRPQDPPIVRWIGISDGNMQEGSFRVDANVSVRPKGRSALRHPHRDQEHQLLPLPGEGDPLRGRAPDRPDRGRRPGGPGDPPLRPGPGRDPLHAHQGGGQRLPLLPGPGPAAPGDRRRGSSRRGRHLPELPDAKRERFRASYGLSEYDASLLTASRELADYFEAVAAAAAAMPKLTANWVPGSSPRPSTASGRRSPRQPGERPPLAG